MRGIKLVEWTGNTVLNRLIHPRNRVVMIKMPDGFQESIYFLDHSDDGCTVTDRIPEGCDLKSTVTPEIRGISIRDPGVFYIKQLEKDLARSEQEA